MTRNKETKRKFKTFNTSGLCIPGKHYMIDPLSRLDEVEGLIHEELYFTIHAPRQTGKTTYLYALAEKLNKEKDYIALVVSFEQAGYPGISVDKANALLNESIYQAATDQLPLQYQPDKPVDDEKIPNLKRYLRTWCKKIDLPLVLFIDEIDALLDEVLISVLRQLRDGYQSRPASFPSSVILVGLRDVRDYKIKIRPEFQSYGNSSPFNIKSDSLTLENFTKQEVFTLLEQHTNETGRIFPSEVKDEIYRLTAGQPWLTNALARQIISKMPGDDYSQPVSLEQLFQAKQQLIIRRDTHLDSLAEKLKEDRVKNIVQAIINGDLLPSETLDDDISYVQDLGIAGKEYPLKFANPIYAEIIPRMMSIQLQASIPGDIQQPWFITANNELDIKKVLTAFQEFYSENAEAWLDRFTFKESAHHLLLMAFLQRLVNSGGEITREMALGNGRIDLLIKFHQQRVAMELKIDRGKKSIEKAKEQLVRYLDRLGLDEGYLVIFDPSGKDWEEKLYIKDIEYKNKKIILVGL